MDNLKHLTVDNLPKALVGKLLEEGVDYEETDEKLIGGKSIVVNRAGSMWVYMADDPRRKPAEQMICRHGRDLGYLGIEKAVKLLPAKYGNV